MIRRAHISDLDALAVLAEAYCRAKQQMASRARIMATLSEQITELPFFVVEKDGKVVGGLSLQLIDHPFSGKPIAGKALWYMSKDGKGYVFNRLQQVQG